MAPEKRDAGDGRGRPPNTEERRREIVAAMMKVIAHQGYSGATIADVALFENLAPGLVHYHFENKLEILLCVLDEMVAAHTFALYDRLARSKGSPADQLEDFVNAHLALPGE